MNDKTADLFQNLSDRGWDPMLGNVTATIRFDINSDRQTSTWRLAIDKGVLRYRPTAAPPTAW
jgi:hypothetical protein